MRHNPPLVDGTEGKPDFIVRLFSRNQELIYPICRFGKKCHVHGKKCRMVSAAKGYDEKRSDPTILKPDQGEKMLKNRLLYAFVVLALGVVAYFTLQVASKGGMPEDYNGRYAPAEQLRSGQ